MRAIASDKDRRSEAHLILRLIPNDPDAAKTMKETAYLCEQYPPLDATESDKSFWKNK
jgi:hypothetical protein